MNLPHRLLVDDQGFTPRDLPAHIEVDGLPKLLDVARVRTGGAGGVRMIRRWQFVVRVSAGAPSTST